MPFLSSALDSSFSSSYDDFKRYRGLHQNCMLLPHFDSLGLCTTSLVKVEVQNHISKSPPRTPAFSYTSSTESSSNGLNPPSSMRTPPHLALDATEVDTDKGMKLESQKVEIVKLQDIEKTV